MTFPKHALDLRALAFTSGWLVYDASHEKINQMISFSYETYVFIFSVPQCAKSLYWRRFLMQAQASTTSNKNKKETSPLDDMLRKSFPALMSEQNSWGIEDIQARGVNGLDIPT